MAVFSITEIIFWSLVVLCILVDIVAGVKAWAKKNKTATRVAVVLGLILLVGAIIIPATPVGRALLNRYDEVMQRTDDATTYKTRKEVEDYCRSAIVNYTKNAKLYEQYKDSDNPRHRDWAEQAKGEANGIAAAYNEYFLKNSFVFRGNVPADIREALEYIS